MIWPSSTMHREELSFKLSDSGTGVAQCLTILAAASRDFPSCIVIDEINSFLHPRAVRTLILILRENYSHHQYIISTHSADVIAYSGPSTAYYVEKINFQSSIKRLDITALEDARPVYRALGISMMDVFGSEKILWVEGQTEEIVFPMLIDSPLSKAGIAIKAVPATGDFSNKKRTRKMVADLYASVVSSVAPLVERMVFSFDRENLSDEAIESFELELDGKLHILPRRNLECYLINPFAITVLLNSYLSDVSVNIADIEEWIEKNGSRDKYRAKKYWNGDIKNVEWLKFVDGALIIKDLFNEITDCKIEFRKTKHSPEIFMTIKNNSPDELSELKRFCEKLFCNLLKD
jgi:hypothetical protein